MFNKIGQALKEKPWLWIVVVLCIPLIPFLLPVAVPAIIVVVIVQSVKENQANDRAPIQTMLAIVVAKRSRVSGGGDMMTSTTYYATFEVETGERLEFRVPGREYGQLAEGDRGALTYQRTRYHGFARGPVGNEQ
jgi:hypothetical protein